MAYNEKLAERVRSALDEYAEISERKMFGGIAFMRGAHMCVGIVGDDLMVRVGPDYFAAALARPNVRPMDFTGRPMKGYVFVEPKGYRTAKLLGDWVQRGALFAATLPPKKPKKK